MSLTFSQRIGIEPPKGLQIDSIDKDLRTGLWNAFYKAIWNRVPTTSNNHVYYYLSDWGATFWLDVTENFLKQPIDEIAYEFRAINKVIKEYFLFSPWNILYNFIEFLCTCPSLEQGTELFIAESNKALKKESSGYRIISNRITPITNSIEIDNIEEAAKSPYEYANQHLQSALEKLSDRKNPDYRNSIKESISAVEAVCRKLTGESSLDRALNKIGNKIDFNSQFKQGLEKLYHYTNGESGIRHALIDEGQPSFDEAKFMLVACSAFVNYLTAKASVLND